MGFHVDLMGLCGIVWGFSGDFIQVDAPQLYGCLEIVKL